MLHYCVIVSLKIYMLCNHIKLMPKEKSKFKSYCLKYIGLLSTIYLNKSISVIYYKHVQSIHFSLTLLYNRLHLFFKIAIYGCGNFFV